MAAHKASKPGGGGSQPCCLQARCFELKSSDLSPRLTQKVAMQSGAESWPEAKVTNVGFSALV